MAVSVGRSTSVLLLLLIPLVACDFMKRPFSLLAKPDNKTDGECPLKYKENLKSVYPASLLFFVLAGPGLSALLLAINISLFFYMRSEIHEETRKTMDKCFEVIDGVLVSLMPKSVLKNLHDAIGGKGTDVGEQGEESKDTKDGPDDAGATGGKSSETVEKKKKKK